MSMWPAQLRRGIVVRSLSGGLLLAVSGLACHSSSPPATTTTPTSGAAVMLSLASLSFIVPGAPQAVTLTNSGPAVLTITSIVGSSNFTESDNCVGSIAVGASCTINVTFVLAVGMPGGSSGVVTITDNAPDSPETITTSGPVVAQAVGALSPPSLTFAPQTVG